MKKIVMLALVIGLTFALGAGVALADKPTVKPPSGKHYNLNIIGLKKCNKHVSEGDPWNGDCFNGNAGDIQTNGHTIFVPLITNQDWEICDTGAHGNIGEEVTVADLQKGVRILVTADYGSDLQVIDRDATDGLARFNLPDGSYAVYARPLGKPNGCMDIDTILCYDEISGVMTRVDCDPTLGNNDQYVLVGHVDVDRGNKQPKWKNVTNELLTVAGVGTDAGYFDYFWEIYNDGLRLLQIRFYKLD